MARRIQIKGVRRSEIDTNLLAYVYFLQGKRLVQQRREREAQAADARERKAQGGKHSGVAR
jgi:uncharacterized protein YdaU (DUF1376 family)